MKADFSFDERVARRYNVARAHPPNVSQQIGEAIAAQAGTHVLELGVGTGRIALPVVAAGCKVVGFDLSPDMLGEGDAGLNLLQADMRQMPFKNAVFDAVLAVHVLHLVPEWPAVLGEATRVLRSGGAFIQGDDWIDPQSMLGQMRDSLRMYVAQKASNFMPPGAGISRQQVLNDLGGGEFEEVIAAEWTVELSPRDRIQAVEQRIDAESWVLPDNLFEDVVQQQKDYAAAHWDDLDTKQPVTRRFILKVSRGDWKRKPI